MLGTRVRPQVPATGETRVNLSARNWTRATGKSGHVRHASSWGKGGYVSVCDH